MKRIKISLLSIVWIVVLILTNTPFIMPLLCAVILHEIGHLLCAKLLKIQIKSFEFSIFGGRIKTEKEPSYIDELLFALGGPLAGIIGFAFTYKFALNNLDIPLCQAFLFPFSVISLCLSIFNLIPLTSLDGGRILKCTLCLLFPLDTADKILRFTSFFTLVSLWMLSVYMMLKTANGVPMFVFCLIFFSKCFIFNIKTRDFERIQEIKRAI